MYPDATESCNMKKVKSGNASYYACGRSKYIKTPVVLNIQKI